MAQRDYRNLSVLLVGAVAGLLLGPWVLGRFGPGLYEQWFVGGQEVRKVLEAFDRKVQQQRQRLEGVGATETALTELDAQERPQRRMLERELEEARDATAQRWEGRAGAVVLSLVLVAVAESLARTAGVRGWLARGRYALMSVWVAMLLACPRLHGEVSLVLVISVVALAVGSAWLLGGRDAADSRA